MSDVSRLTICMKFTKMLCRMQLSHRSRSGPDVQAARERWYRGPRTEVRREGESTVRIDFVAVEEPAY